MAEVTFTYEGIFITIQCNINDKFEHIIKRFLIKIKKEENDNLIYLYNGSKLKKELTFYEHANQIDKCRNKMNVAVYNTIEELNIKKEIYSKDIICPNCKEKCSIEIKNFKINFKCKNNHINNNILLDNILLDKYFETQKLYLNEINCDICQVQNKGITNENKFYFCNTCKCNICPLCQSIHEKKYYKHSIIDYDDKNYLCKKHNDMYTKFCKTCNEDICIICKDEHNGHELIEFDKIFIKKEEFIKRMEELKQSIDKFRYKIDTIKKIFDKMIYILDIYYKINEDIISNFDMQKRNYYNLLNISDLMKNNKLLIEDINNAINNDNISEIYNYSCENFYNENGEKYIGEIKNGLKEGKGILYYNIIKMMNLIERNMKVIL